MWSDGAHCSSGQSPRPRNSSIPGDAGSGSRRSPNGSTTTSPPLPVLASCRPAASTLITTLFDTRGRWSIGMIARSWKVSISPNAREMGASSESRCSTGLYPRRGDWPNSGQVARCVAAPRGLRACSWRPPVIRDHPGSHTHIRPRVAPSRKPRARRAMQEEDREPIRVAALGDRQHPPIGRNRRHCARRPSHDQIIILHRAHGASPYSCRDSTASGWMAAHLSGQRDPAAPAVAGAGVGVKPFRRDSSS
jgi:hypothetical protein